MSGCITSLETSDENQLCWMLIFFSFQYCSKESFIAFTSIFFWGQRWKKWSQDTVYHFVILGCREADDARPSSWSLDSRWAPGWRAAVAPDRREFPRLESPPIPGTAVLAAASLLAVLGASSAHCHKWLMALLNIALKGKIAEWTRTWLPRRTLLSTHQW